MTITITIIEESRGRRISAFGVPAPSIVATQTRETSGMQGSLARPGSGSMSMRR
jgi:hypothetical protein